MRAGRYVGLEARGCGSVAANAAACALLSRDGGTPKYAALAAVAPQTPGPHSDVLR